MPYSKNTDLPDRVKDHLPEHAQDIYREAFNHAFDEYKNASKRRTDESQEEVAHKVAWSAVKEAYEKSPSGASGNDLPSARAVLIRAHGCKVVAAGHIQ